MPGLLYSELSSGHLEKGRAAASVAWKPLPAVRGRGALRCGGGSAGGDIVPSPCPLCVCTARLVSSVSLPQVASRRDTCPSPGILCPCFSHSHVAIQGH